MTMSIKIPAGFKNDLIYWGRIVCVVFGIVVVSRILTYLLSIVCN